MEHTLAADGDIATIALKGEIDLEQASRMRDFLLKAVADHAYNALIIDLGDVSLIDSSGIANLLEAFQAARKRAKPLILAAIGEDVFRVLKLARLDTVFVIEPDVAAAKQALG